MSAVAPRSRRILKVRAPDLDERLPSAGFVTQRIAQDIASGQQAFGNSPPRSNVQRRRKTVVRRLAHVDMIVRMHRHLAAARVRQRLVGETRNHLVDVHVALCATAGLPDDERELVVMLARRDRDRCFFDRVCQFGIQPMRPVHLRCGLLHDRQRMDDFDWHPLAVAEREIPDTALCLRAPIGIGGDFDWAETVALGAGGRHFFRLKSTATTFDPSSTGSKGASFPAASCTVGPSPSACT